MRMVKRRRRRGREKPTTPNDQVEQVKSGKTFSGSHQQALPVPKCLVWFPNPLAAGSDFFKADGDPVYQVPTPLPLPSIYALSSFALDIDQPRWVTSCVFPQIMFAAAWQSVKN